MKMIRINMRGVDSGKSKNFHETYEDRIMFSYPNWACREGSWQPCVDICSCPEGFLVLVELAGVEIGEVNLEVEGLKFKLTGKRARFIAPAGSSYHLAEIVCGSFERIFSLPLSVDAERITATFQRGILEIRMPLSPRNTQKRKIRVSGG